MRRTIKEVLETPILNGIPFTRAIEGLITYWRTQNWRVDLDESIEAQDTLTKCMAELSELAKAPVVDVNSELLTACHEFYYAYATSTAIPLRRLEEIIRLIGGEGAVRNAVDLLGSPAPDEEK